MDPTDAEVACFEAGVKFGTLYHQFAGTPVSPRSAASLARAIEEAVENQPHCESVSVEPDMDAIRERSAQHGYTELTGRLMDVEVVVEYQDVEVTALMAMDDGYPLMWVESVEGREG